MRTVERPAARSSRQRVPRLSLREQAYEAIKTRIITLEFRPGEFINTAAVSDLLGLGRTPVQQAIDRLMFEKLVEVIPRKGVIVKPVIPSEVLQMAEVRMINETYCARLATERADRSDIEKLEKIIGKAKSAIKQRDVRALMELDRQFHGCIAAASKNAVLIEILRKLNEQSLRFWFTTFTTATHHLGFQKDHETLYEAIRDQDPDAAEDAMREHIEAFRKGAVRQM